MLRGLLLVSDSGGGGERFATHEWDNTKRIGTIVLTVIIIIATLIII